MNKKLLEEVSRQKELMNINEQNVMGDIADKIVGSLSNNILKSIFKNTLNPDSEDGEVEDVETDELSIEKKLSTNDFDTAVDNVIKNLEGGYYHPNMLKDGRLKNTKSMGDSGETMMGMDRKYGVDFAKTSAGREFWGLIDDANASQKWKWNYMGGPLESKLRDLVPQMIKPVYESLSNKYLSSEARKIVQSDPRLTFNFIYATWNGPGWFQKFAKKINDAVNNGITNPKELTKIAIKARTESGNSIIAQGGKKVSDVINSTYS
jgi:hypothetical protein